uniref:Folliculin n=1 Tax=Globodera rostochiensis TaxID=31243 RepID=A0A914HWZ1_GLORO
MFLGGSGRQIRSTTVHVGRCEGEGDDDGDDDGWKINPPRLTVECAIRLFRHHSVCRRRKMAQLSGAERRRPPHQKPSLPPQPSIRPSTTDAQTHKRLMTMQTAVALCYFCENHGPRVVIACQPMRNCELPHSSSPIAIRKRGEEEEQKRCSSAFAASTLDNGGAELGEQWKDLDDDGDSPLFCGDLYAGNEVVDEETRCAACSSFDHGAGLLSKDRDAEISYVSTQVPISERLNHVLRQACLRSLSVEISAPLSFDTTSEPQQANYICSTDPSSSSSSNFNQKFGNGPGQREYVERDGIVLFGDDEHWYTLSYIFRLKDAKARGFHRCYSLVVISADKLLLLRNYDFLVHTLGGIIGHLQQRTDAFFALEQQKDSELRLASNVSNSSKGALHWLPHQFYPKQYALDTKRSLKVIFNSEHIFITLHRQMLNLLKTLSGLDKDIVLEGCPTQDMLTAMEMEQSDSSEERELIAQLTPGASLLHLTNLRIIVERLKSGDNLSTLTALIWHVVIGGQVVAQSASLSARSLFLLSLVQLLPVGCVRLAANSKHYTFPHEHNFLGCAPSVQIPSDVLPDIVLVTLSEKAEGSSFFLKGRRRISRLLLAVTASFYSIRYSMTSLWPALCKLKNQRNAIDLDRVINIIKCRPNDSPVILFWQRGLARHYQQAVQRAASKYADKSN